MSTFPDPVAADYAPPDPPYFGENQPKTLRLYPLGISSPRQITDYMLANYTFGTKEAQPEEDPSVLSRLNRLQEHYEKYGMRRSCEAILVVNIR
jgi:cleavage and polyadenylation specificity factor subunit 5